MFKDSQAFSSFAVKDLDEAKRFYGETLGQDVRDGPMGVLELHLAGGAQAMVYPKPDHEPANFTVLNFSVPDVDAAVDQLTSAGVKMEQYGREAAPGRKGHRARPEWSGHRLVHGSLRQHHRGADDVLTIGRLVIALRFDNCPRAGSIPLG